MLQLQYSPASREICKKKKKYHLYIICTTIFSSCDNEHFSIIFDLASVLNNNEFLRSGKTRRKQHYFLRLIQIGFIPREITKSFGATCKKRIVETNGHLSFVPPACKGHQGRDNCRSISRTRRQDRHISNARQRRDKT